MPISRRTLILAGVASMVGCSSKKGLSDAAPMPIGADNDSGLRSAGVKNPPKDKVPTSIAMVGDSITNGSKVALELVLTDIGFSSITINAEASRRIEVGGKQPMPGLDVVTFIAATDPPDMWVIALGTNDAGLYTGDGEYRSLIEQVLGAIPRSAPLVWVNAYRADHLDGCEQFNTVLRSMLEDRGHATVAEWYELCLETEGSLLSDGVHPNDGGILVFADTVRRAIATELA